MFGYRKWEFKALTGSTNINVDVLEHNNTKLVTGHRSYTSYSIILKNTDWSSINSCFHLAQSQNAILLTP